MKTNGESPLTAACRAALESAGITGAVPIPAGIEHNPETAYSRVCFRWFELKLVFERERLIDRVSVASPHSPGRPFLFDDITIAQGWRSLDSVVSRSGPASVADDLLGIVRYRDLLESLTARANFVDAAARFGDAHSRRGRAFLAKLDRLAKE